MNTAGHLSSNVHLKIRKDNTLLFTALGSRVSGLQAWVSLHGDFRGHRSCSGGDVTHWLRVHNQKTAGGEAQIDHLFISIKLPWYFMLSRGKMWLLWHLKFCTTQGEGGGTLLETRENSGWTVHWTALGCCTLGSWTAAKVTRRCFVSQKVLGIYFHSSMLLLLW